MNLADATKAVKAEKPKEGFLVFEFEYGRKFVIPHTAGTAILAALEYAEQLTKRYSEPSRIHEVNPDAYSAKPMSRQEYERYKIAALLGLCSPDQVEDAQEQAHQASLTRPTP